ncbi:MAG TPA: TonB C-terminal domain-containing protein [Gemmatimonadales bacterium]|jgi:protein TonB|nr:TonB C-terminal domain-containing protein [Gemmatimonadales bacterium]
MQVRQPVPREGPSVTAGLIGTTMLHAAAVALVIIAPQQSAKAGPPSYAVELVAAPEPAPQVKKAAPEAIPTPPEEKAAPIKPRPAKLPPAPAKPEPKPPPEPEKKEAPAKTRAPEPPLPGETPSTGTDVATVKTPGLDFPYPEYLRNIVAEVYRRWDRPAGAASLQAEVSFLILRDGSVREIRFTRSSGNFSFDLDAQGAVEAAGNARAFGPLPDGYPSDVLPVSFYFTPRPR